MLLPVWLCLASHLLLVTSLFFKLLLHCFAGLLEACGLSIGFDLLRRSIIECQRFQTAVIPSSFVYRDVIVTARVRSHIVNPEEPDKLVFFLANLPGSRKFIELIDFYQE